jgi:CSLREA domain-containing protein
MAKATAWAKRRRFKLLALLAALLLAVAVTLVVAIFAQAAPHTVDSTADRVDSNIGDGVCRTSMGTCTLRAAIQESNALSGHDTIQVPAGTFELGIPTINDDLPSTGDFDITDTVTITGAGMGATIIDGGIPPQNADPDARGLDRLFEVHPTSGNVTFSNLALREGFSAEDGALYRTGCRGCFVWKPSMGRTTSPPASAAASTTPSRSLTIGRLRRSIPRSLGASRSSTRSCPATPRAAAGPR